MVKQHLKRLAVPKTWPIKRRGITFITRPMPGPHPLNLGMPLNVILRDILKLANTNSEAKKIVVAQGIMVDAKKVHDYRRIVGLMDAISISKVDAHYRVLINESNNLQLVKMDEKEATIKPCVIRNKSVVKGKIQLNLSDGRNLLVDKDVYKVGDSVLIELPGQMIKEHIALEKGNAVYLIGGKHVGSLGVIESINDDNITFKLKKGGSFETAKKYAYVVGKAKPAIASIENISNISKEIKEGKK